MYLLQRNTERNRTIPVCRIGRIGIYESEGNICGFGGSYLFVIYLFQL